MITTSWDAPQFVTSVSYRAGTGRGPRTALDRISPNFVGAPRDRRDASGPVPGPSASVARSPSLRSALHMIGKPHDPWSWEGVEQRVADGMEQADIDRWRAVYRLNVAFAHVLDAAARETDFYERLERILRTLE
ncbi:MAG: hypothetical protein ACREQ5_37615 [Candidatus Dormibacteria bacterium]